MWTRRAVLPALISAAMLRRAAGAEAYPARPIRVVVPFSAGGGTDIVARTIMAHVAESLGGVIVIDNRGGAGGVIGTGMIAAATPDGYTLGVVSGGHAVNPSLYKNLPYDSLRSFEPISLLCSGPGVLVINPALPVHSVKELIAYARAQSTPLPYASAGVGTPPHLAAELFLAMAGLQMTHVPYKGNDQAMLDVISNRVPLSFPTAPSALAFIHDGKLRPLAVTSSMRASALPDVPSLAEAGLPGYDASSWYGLLAPAATPAPVIAALHAAVDKAMHNPDLRARLLDLGLEPVGGTPDAFAKTIAGDIVKWDDLAKRTNIQPN
jgi:tripartite-type tricarboxylate transporter receptor subunit TctC